MRVFYTLIFLCVVLCVKAQPVTSSVIGTPDQVHCDVPIRTNNVVFGAIPPNSEDKPVLVFSHGWFDNGYSFFMMRNKWYEDAYNAGYRTAFMFQSTSGAFEDNGRDVADMIRETCRHYNTSKIIAICHSKGGYDMEYALYNSGIWDTVQGVITLSTPFWGAPMSDMIANPIFRAILENIPGVGPTFQGRGSYQMQTAYMAGVVRPMMDNHPDNHPEKFHCFGAWGSDHHNTLPDDIPDDAIRVVNPMYVSSCQPSGFLVHMFMEGLFTDAMIIIGAMSRTVHVQSKYENPQHNETDMDGLSPYYSAIRPGSVEVSARPPDSSSYLNHLDVVWADVMWDRVFHEVEYFKDHPVLRKSNVVPVSSAKYEGSSTSTFIQSKTISINTSAENKLFVVGDFKNEKIDVLDESNQLVKSIPINVSTQGLYDVFHTVDLSSLSKNKKYTLQASKELVGILQDGNNAALRLNANADKTFYADEPLGFEIGVENWSDDLATTTVKGILNRNMDANGNVIHDKIVPVSFQYDNEKQVFVCKDKVLLDDGVYNLSVFAEGATLKRFITTSVLIKQERKANTTSENISIYPNPANDVVHIRFIGKENTDYSIQAFDLLGKKVAEKKLGNANGIQDVELSASANAFAKGAYMISVVANGERVGAKVVVVE